MRHVHRPLLKAVLGVVTHPRVTLVVAGGVLAVCVLLAVFRLPISTDQDKLFNRDVPFFRDYLEFDRKFPENEAVVVVVRPADPAHPPAVERWTAAADAIAGRVGQLTKAVERVDAKVPLEQLGSQGVLFEDTTRLPERVAEVKRFVPLAQLWGEPPGLATRLLGRTPIERFLGALNAEQALAAASTRPSDAQTAGFVAALAATWNRALAEPNLPMRPGQALPDLARLGAETPADLGYYYVRNEDPSDPAKYLLLVQVYPKENYTALTAVSETVESIRAAVNESAKEFPEFKVGVTGRPALEADEMRTTDRDSNRAEVIALIAVFIGIAVVLRSLWLALAAEICLGVGIGWTFGWATVSVGELNLLSIVFLIALIGIGMDYLVQILTRYRQEAGRRGNPRTVWLAVFKHVGPPINTACMGAAGAFLVAWITRKRFQGAADLGIIAGGGLLLCLVSGYTVLPALLTLLPGRRRVSKGPTPSPRYSGGREGVRGRLFKWRRVPWAGDSLPVQAAPSTGSLSDPDPPKNWRRRLILPVLWVCALYALAPQYRKVRFDPGLLNLQAPQLESVRLVHKLQTWSAVVLSQDLKVLREARAVYEPSPVVGRTESILQAYDNYDWLHQHAGELPQVRWTEPAAVQPDDLKSLADRARALADRYAVAASKPQTQPAAANDLTAAARELRTFAGRLSAIAKDGSTATGAAHRLSEWQTAFVAELREMLGQFNPRPLNLDRVPRELRSHFVSADGTCALWVYPKNDLWNRQSLEQFVRDVERRTSRYPGLPKPTGIAINVYHTTDAIRGAFLRDTIYALALIVILVFIDLRKIDQTFMAISVLGFGLPMLLGVMVLLDRAAARGWLQWLDLQEMSWNFANFFTLPILIGAGHEYGVFMVHRYREALLDPRRAWRGWEVSDWALLLCAYITSTSFGFFGILADHRGLKSLGLVMAMGTACIYLATLAVLRPILQWRLARRQARAAVDGAGSASAGRAFAGDSIERQDAETPR